MSLGDPVERADPLRLPDGFGDTRSWNRASDESAITRNRLNRAEWMVTIGDGGYHRVTFVLDGGEALVNGTCDGFRHRGFCAHVAAMIRGYIRGHVEPADISEPLGEEVDRLWREVSRSPERREVRPR